MTKRQPQPLKIVFLDRGTLGTKVELKSPGFLHELVCHDATPADLVVARAAAADVLVVNKVPITAATLERARHLRFIAVAATGCNNIDLDACRARGIVVSNIRGYARRTVPEHVFAMIFALRRSLVPYRNSVIRGRWQECGQFCYFDYPISDLAGSTLGIVGRGELGLEVGRIADAFGMRVQYAARKGAVTSEPGRVPFAEFLQTSDIITLHCPQTAETSNLLSHAEFALMRRRPILINTARGGLIDDEALVEALDRNMVSAVGLDVADTEPPSRDHPLMRIASRDNVILTPHVAWASHEAVQSLADQLVGNIEAFAQGCPRNVVT